MTETLRDRPRLPELSPMLRAAQPTIVERSLPIGLGSAVKAFEQLAASTIESSDGAATLELAHPLRLRGFGVACVATVQIVGAPDALTIDIAMAEAADGTSMVRLATRGSRRQGFDTAHSVLHDLAVSLEARCRDQPVSVPP